MASQFRFAQRWHTKINLIAVPVVLIFFYTILSGTYQNSNARQLVEPQHPEVSIKSQPSAPIQILTINENSLTPHTPQLEMLVSNVSNKAISAYAIRYVIPGQLKEGNLELSIAASPDSVLLPNQSTFVNIGEELYYSGPIIAISISVDFVEFTDGITWGSDIHKSAQLLKGMRAGARLAATQFLKVLEESDPLTLIDSIDSVKIDIPQPQQSQQSPQWLKGFQQGIGHIRERLKVAYKKGGISEIEPTLRRPFDAFERKQLQ